jgi:hypothetical protein
VSPSIPPVYLIPSARPPQSFVYGVGGFSDGFSVDSSVYSVFLIGYITYVAPTDAMAGTIAGPSPNSAEAVSATVSLLLVNFKIILIKFRSALARRLFCRRRTVKNIY